MNIDFSIISRGTLLVKYNGLTMKIAGELTFDPPVFYADLSSMNNWEEPNYGISVLENERQEIIRLLSEKSSEEGTRIIFD